MKPIIILILLTALLSFASCSADKTDKQPSTKLAPLNIKTKPHDPNIPKAQNFQPDLHLSGTKSTRISGASATKHLSGQ
jgi:hypothetical protein